MAPSSMSVPPETVKGSHEFVIEPYSQARGIGVGRHITSGCFTVGGYKWAIYFYPDGKDHPNPEDDSDSTTYVSVFVALSSEGRDVRALFELTLVDQSGNGRHKVHSHFDRWYNWSESGPHTLKGRGSMWGFKRYFRRDLLEASHYLKDDCLKINCTVGVVVSPFHWKIWKVPMLLSRFNLGLSAFKFVVILFAFLSSFYFLITIKY